MKYALTENNKAKLPVSETVFVFFLRSVDTAEYQLIVVRKLMHIRPQLIYSNGKFQYALKGKTLFQSFFVVGSSNTPKFYINQVTRNLRIFVLFG